MIDTVLLPKIQTQILPLPLHQLTQQPYLPLTLITFIWVLKMLWFHLRSFQNRLLINSRILSHHKVITIKPYIVRQIYHFILQKAYLNLIPTRTLPVHLIIMVHKLNVRGTTTYIAYLIMLR